MGGFALSWVQSDQERETLYPPKPGHVCAWGMWQRADPAPNVISRRYKRWCKCGRVQYGRGSQCGLNITPETPAWHGGRNRVRFVCA